jgi:phosphoribosyl-ATP pyrophosphohydrolase
MNVEDIESVTPTKDKLVEIFERQEELTHKYIPIEVRNGIGYGILPEDHEHDIDSRYTQALLKDFAWRSVEEITEATEALSKNHEVHPQEEIADALHFLVELCIIAGIGPDDVAVPPRPNQEGDKLDILFDAPYQDGPLPEIARILNTRMLVYNYIEDLGIAMNCLKNKPWKQTQFVTDKAKFRQAICNAFHGLIDVATSFRMNSHILYDFYFKKNQVNQFRVRSKY